MSATHEDIARFLNRDDLSPGVKSLVKWQFNMHGDFWSAVWLAISKADDRNLSRLGLAFPDEVSAFRAWAHGGLGDAIRAAGLGI